MQKNVLYIEDNPDNLKVLCFILASLRPSVNILVAGTAEEGIHIAMQKRPDLILMDINLPGIDGYEALEILNAGLETRSIPVVAVSAHALAEHIRRGMEAGFDAYITKPVNVDILRGVLDRFLPEGELYAQSNVGMLD